MLVEDAEIPFPDTVQALIAARLDTLAADRKALLADAAVVGKVFWAGAVAAMGDLAEVDVVDILHELSRKELVRPSRRSTMEGEAEYAFWHVLARDVAYTRSPAPPAPPATSPPPGGSSPRHRTGSKTSPTCSPTTTPRPWTWRSPPARPTSPTSRSPRCGSSPSPGNVPSAWTPPPRWTRSNAPWPSPHPGTPSGPTPSPTSGMPHETAAASPTPPPPSTKPSASTEQRGDILPAARAMGSLCGVLERLNDPRRVELPAQALALLEPLPPGPELVDALLLVAQDATLGGAPEEGIALVERALAIAAEAGLPHRP